MSGIKGFPTQQKVVNNQPTWHDFVTVQPTDSGLRYSLDILRNSFRVNNESVPRTAGVGTGNPSDGSGTLIADTSTPARVGDFVRFIDGLGKNLEIPIIQVNTNSFKLGARLPSSLLPASGDSFFINRYVTARTNEDGSQIISFATASAVGLGRVVASSGAPITTAAYTQLVASTPIVKEIEVDNTTGKTLVLAIGPVAGEVDTIYIPTKGLSRQVISIPIGSRLSLKAMGGNATFGEVNINLFA